MDETVAAVLVEPVAANMNLVAPSAGIPRGVCARSASRVGAVLIFDEVITGFRLAFAGAEEYFGVTPDLWCFGKVIGGGLPVGAFGGSREMMSALAPLGPVYQAGTLSGNPLATAAGTTVLDHVTPRDYEELTRRVEAFASDLEAAVNASGLFARCPTQGPLMGLFLARATVRRARRTSPRPRRCARTGSTGRSSTRCSSAASPWPRAPTRSSSSRWPTARTISPAPWTRAGEAAHVAASA